MFSKAFRLIIEICKPKGCIHVCLHVKHFTIATIIDSWDFFQQFYSRKEFTCTHMYLYTCTCICTLIYVHVDV